MIENKVNSGPSINTNIAIRNSGCDLISIIASDDLMQKDRLQKSYDFMMKNSCDAVFTFVDMIDENGDICSNHPILETFNQAKDKIELLRHFFYNGNFICAPSVTIKRSVFEDLGYFNPSLLQLQDFDLWVRMAIKNHKILFLEEKLTYYRSHGENLSGITYVKDFCKLNSRYYVEYSRILENFLKISFEDFLLVFKDELKNFSIIKEEYVPFYLSLIAFNLSQIDDGGAPSIQKKCFNKFAIEAMSDIFLSESNIANLYKDLGFSFKNFIDIVSNNIAIKENLSPKEECPVDNSQSSLDQEGGEEVQENSSINSEQTPFDQVYIKKSPLLKFRNSCGKRMAELRKILKKLQAD